jgi:hypothetical protein
MLSAQAQSALSTLTTALRDRPELLEPVRGRWGRNDPTRSGERGSSELSPSVCDAADRLAEALAILSRSDHTATVDELFTGPDGEIVLAWCEASAGRRDVRLARLLAVAAQSELAERAVGVARDRTVQGPLLDALACAPLLGDGAQLALPVNLEARARLEILFWEAGASAIEVADLAPWIWGSVSTFDALVRSPAHGALRGRVLAARCLEVSVRGLRPTTDPELIGQTLRVLQPLVLHPEPLVWVHAARALGRLTGALEQLEGMLLDWALGESPLLRQRAMTAFASLPA